MEEDGNGNGQVVDQNQLAQIMGQLRQSVPWSTVMKKTVELIKKMDPKDRLGYSRCVMRIINAVKTSMKGWTDWLINLDVLDELSETEFEEISKRLAELALELKTISIMSEVLKKASPKDRVEHAVLIADSVNTISTTLLEFNYYFTGLKSVENVSDEVWKIIFPKFRKLAIEILSVDFSISEKKEVEAEARLREREKNKPKSEDKKKKDAYVA